MKTLKTFERPTTLGAAIAKLKSKSLDEVAATELVDHLAAGGFIAPGDRLGTISK